MAADPEMFHPHRPESVDLHHRVEPPEAGVVLACNRSGDGAAGGRANAAALNRDRVGDLLQLVVWTPGIMERTRMRFRAGSVKASGSRAQLDLSFALVSHDISVVSYLCGQVGVMFRGKTVELDDAETVCTRPNHEYTQRLISVAPNADAAQC